MSAVLAAEVAAAEDAERAISFCHGLQTIETDAALAFGEAAFERAAIVFEGSADGGCCGLVPVPTSGPKGSAYRVQQRSRALRAALRATETDKHRARIARMRQQVGFSARAIQVAGRRPGFRPHYVAMLTATYADAADWRPRHLSDLLKHVRRWLQRRGYSMQYVWVAELQERGAIHYHVGLWLPEGVKIPKPDKQGWWEHGSTRIEAARDAVGYLMSYLSKGGDHLKLPDGARMHGSGGVEHSLRRARRWLSMPAWVQARADSLDDWRPAFGGGWRDPCGTVIPSEHVRAWLGDRWGAVRVADYGRPFEAHGPFTWIDRGPSC